MKPVDMSEFFWGVSPEDPDVVNAMEVYDHLDEIERRNVYRSMIQAMVAYRREGNNTARLEALTEGTERMIRMDAIPGLREKIHAQRNVVPEPADPADVEALIRELQGGADR